MVEPMLEDVEPTGYLFPVWRQLFKTGVSNPSYLGLKNTLKIVKSVVFNKNLLNFSTGKV